MQDDGERRKWVSPRRAISLSRHVSHSTFFFIMMPVLASIFRFHRGGGGSIHSLCCAGPNGLSILRYDCVVCVSVMSECSRSSLAFASSSSSLLAARLRIYFLRLRGVVVEREWLSVYVCHYLWCDGV